MPNRVRPAATIAPDRGGRANLVSEAVQLLSTQGIHGMSIGKLAERAGYSKGGIMAHFHSKREMVLTLVEESVTMARRYFREELKGATSPTERLQRTLTTYGSYWTSGLFEGGCPFLNLAVDAVDANDDVALALRKAARTFIDDFANVVRLGQATGEFHPDADPVDVGERLMSLCVGCGWTCRMTGDAAIFERMQPAVDGIVAGISRRRSLTERAERRTLHRSDGSSRGEARTDPRPHRGDPAARRN